ncbi:hypothetical protein AGMMS50267_06130 [Spirochaetia bacterium]|nr:hypothetical protein AGMMS50267_06130 [Spirochaetia bacterium]
MLDKIISGAQQFLSGIRQASDMVLDATIEEGLKKAQEKLDAMDKKSRHNFFLSFCFDMVFIAVAIVCSIIRFKYALPLLLVIGFAKLAHTLVRLVLLFRDLKPHRKLIQKFVPVFVHELVHSRSLEKSIQAAIRYIFKFFYGEKINAAVKTVHNLTSFIGATPSVSEIEDKAVDNFYPPLNRYIRRLLLINVMCFIGFYGILVGIVKFYLISVL